MSNRRPTATNRFALAALGAVLGVVLGYPLAAAAAEHVAEAPVIKVSETVTVVDTSATIRFGIARVEGENLDVSVFYGKKDGGTEEADWAHPADKVSIADDPSGYSATLEDLEPETQYYFRIRAINPAGTTWSGAVELLTLPKSTPIYRVLLAMVGIVALLVGPFYLGSRLARRFRMPEHGWKIGVVLWSVACGCVVTYTGWPPKLGIDLSGGVILVYELEDPSQEEGPEGEAGFQDDQAIDIDKLISAIELRVNPGGQRQVDIRKYGAKQIEVTIPRADEEQVRRIQEKISSAGTLEFRILANNRDHKLEIEKALESDDRIVWDGERKEKLAWWVPVEADQETNFEGYGEIATRRMSYRGKPMQHVLVVNDTYNITGGYLSQSRTGVDQNGRPCVFFTFNTRGGQLFGGLTGENLPDEAQDFSRKLGIILDRYLYSAPAIRSTIYNRGEITGGFTREEVEDLVDVLNAGSLPAALKKNPISKLSTGPTLGRDTIERGKYAILFSMAMVLVFMLIYYRFCGIVASMALVVNLVLILGVMIAIQADFTLPGLAGLVLTIGIAVDASPSTPTCSSLNGSGKNSAGAPRCGWQSATGSARPPPPWSTPTSPR
jgi:SecD/SecF fusion protein